MTRKLMAAVLLCCAGGPVNGQNLNEDLDGMVTTLLYWEDARPAGMKVELREVSRTRDHGLVLTSYEVEVRGVSPGVTLVAVDIRIGQKDPEKITDEALVANDGRLCEKIAPDGHCQRPAQISLISAQAEAHRLSLVDGRGVVTIPFLVVPDPVRSESEGCHIEVIRLTRRFEGALLFGKGFKPRETVKYVAESNGVPVRQSGKADVHGEFHALLAPMLNGQKAGTNKVDVKSSHCALSVTYDWTTI